MNVFEKSAKLFVSVDFANSQHSLGPSISRDEIYHRIFNFTSDLGLVAELQQAQQHSLPGD